jgi:hypothetical protein
LEWGFKPSQGRYLHRSTQTQNKGTQTSMAQVVFEPTNPVFERAETVHDLKSLDRAVTVIGWVGDPLLFIQFSLNYSSVCLYNRLE